MGEIADEIHELALKIAVLQNSLELREEAVILQAREYERRLGDLNHAHQQAMERNAQYVSREIWETSQRGTYERLEAIQSEVNKRLSSLENWQSRITGLHIGIGLGAGLAGGSIGALIVKLFK